MALLRWFLDFSPLLQQIKIRKKSHFQMNPWFWAQSTAWATEGYQSCKGAVNAASWSTICLYNWALNFAQWRYSNQWSNREVELLLVENYSQYPAWRTWNTVHQGNIWKAPQELADQTIVNTFSPHENIFFQCINCVFIWIFIDYWITFGFFPKIKAWLKQWSRHKIQCSTIM